MPHLKSHEICPNGLSYFLVPLQGCSICNLLYLLKIVEPRLVSNAIPQHYNLELILLHLFKNFFSEGFKDYIRAF